jgi:hypothetical protein
MKSFLSLIFISSLVLSAGSQPVSDDRCKVTRVEDSDRFERWLVGKQDLSARKQKTLYKIPVVVHVLHRGEAIGEGFNHSKARIEAQIRVLNEDFRRKEGTPGFNVHPDGGDAQIEFVLAKIDPDGNPTDGIVRIDVTSVQVPPINFNIILQSSQYSYWNPNEYANVWTMDLAIPPGLFLGEARFPVSNLEGLRNDDDSQNADGIFINAPNFGLAKTNIDPNFNMGRTLTHEMGHFLGLLHIWGATTFDGVDGCSSNGDYCNDTPMVSTYTSGCTSAGPLACNGGPAMIGNYMDWSNDICMSLFTNDQITRMRTVLENSVRRKSLLTSPALGDLVTGIPVSEISEGVKVFPNPAVDRIYISLNDKACEGEIVITGYTPSGEILITKRMKCASDMTVEMETTGIRDRVLILDIKSPASSSKQLVVIR